MGWKGVASGVMYGLGEMVLSIAVGLFANIRGIVTSRAANRTYWFAAIYWWLTYGIRLTVTRTVQVKNIYLTVRYGVYTAINSSTVRIASCG